MFGTTLPQNLGKLQRRLRCGYSFAPAHGATPSKGGGKAGKRPIVVAPLPDRVVQRAILDVLQAAKDVPVVQAVLATPTSIGGIRGRGVDRAIALIQERFEAGDQWIAGSDIASFFTRIPRADVVAFIRSATSDDGFTNLFERALTVELGNADHLSEDERKLFPTGPDGVAQGCPLSALAGNIVLRDFDSVMNDRGITCVRYIDDFVLIGPSRNHVASAMRSAGNKLTGMGMSIYDPNQSPEKAFIGRLGEDHVFLGYQLNPGAYPPAAAACDRLLDRIRAELRTGLSVIRKAARGDIPASGEKCYAQTLASVDRIMRGWRGSFSSTVETVTFGRLDALVDRELESFDCVYRQVTRGKPAASRRRALGLPMLSDALIVEGAAKPKK